MATATEWQTRTMRRILELLVATGGTMLRPQVQAALGAEVQPSEPRDVEVQSNGQQRWWSYAAWGTTDMVQGGAMTKDGAGTWTITDAGRAMLDEYHDPYELLLEVKRRGRKARQAAKFAIADASQRAWLVRGSSVLGVNLVQEWLSDGWCSIAASQLPPIADGIGTDELKATADDAYTHLKYQERVAVVSEIVDFVTRMKAGDLVLTTSETGVYVGELGAGWSYEPTEDRRSNLRRPVTWRNPDAGVDFSELPATLQAKLRTGSTVADLTGELSSIDNLFVVDEVDDEGDGGGGGVPPTGPHQGFSLLDTTVAKSLLVTKPWLDDFVALLNDSRQVVLYGPPGTGKTYLARKIAEHLVGTERVRLVQFHPSYTYEDFFEGYRPAGNSQAGTVSLELRPGPLRALATEARNHPDQAFVMIIDELNRANIAKVFGELYFLLEYRDDAVNVMYGDEPFTLPKNLYFICTMNTADRSIALLDAAMRRRFTFLELHPATEPTRSMLPQWLAERDHPQFAAELLARVNALIDDRDAHIGPSYFMHNDQSEQRLRRVFQTQIEPLLRETFYDRWSSLGSKFDFDRLWKEVAPTAVSKPAIESAVDAEPPADASAPADVAQLPPPAVGEAPAGS